MVVPLRRLVQVWAEGWAEGSEEEYPVKKEEHKCVRDT